MVLNIDSDTAYFDKPKARSRVADYFHLSSEPTITHYPQLNRTVLIECKTLCHVVSSVS